MLALILICISYVSIAQSPVGKWKIISHTVEFEGRKMEMHGALLKTRPCADKIVWEINADNTFRQNLEQTTCDNDYKKIQTRMYSKTKWKIEGKTFSTSVDGFTGHYYTISFSGNKMTMIGTDGEGVIVYQRL